MRKTGIIIGAVVLLGILFFWFEIRPSNIRMSCSSQAQQEAVTQYENSPLCHDNSFTKFGGTLANCVDGKTYRIPNYNQDFNVCLEQYGLNQ